MTDALVTVVIPLYNYEKYVGACLASCANQQYGSQPLALHCAYEIIVVDDASTDGSFASATKTQSIGGPIKILSHATNFGYSAAKNTAIQYSIYHHWGQKNHFFVHLDADDALYPDGIALRLMVFEKRPELDVVHGIAMRWYGDNDVRGYNPNRYPHAQGVMIRREVYEKYGLYYEGLRSKSDKEMWFRIGLHPESPLPKVVREKRIKQPVALYRKHDLQMHKTRKGTEYDREIEKIFRRRIRQLKSEGITHENTRFPNV